MHVPERHQVGWKQRSARAHRVSYTVERVVLWGGAGTLVASAVVLVKWWWP